MASGYSNSPQARKLGLHDGTRIALIECPDDWAFDDPPQLKYVARGPADVVIRFLRAAQDIGVGLDALERRIFPDGAIWFAWPRRAAGHQSDVTDTEIRNAILPRGLVDTKVCAIDENWSGLKVVWRKENR